MENHVKHLIKALTLLTPLALIACTASYIEPLPSTPTANINFNNVVNFRGEVNAVKIYHDPMLCTNVQSISAGFSEKLTRVPANKLLTFSYYHQQYLGMKINGYDYNICRYIISFIPKENKSYNIKVQEGAEINGKYSCDITFLDNTNPSIKKPVNYIVRYENSIAKPNELTKQCEDTLHLLKQLK